MSSFNTRVFGYVDDGLTGDGAGNLTVTGDLDMNGNNITNVNDLTVNGCLQSDGAAVHICDDLLIDGSVTAATAVITGDTDLRGNVFNSAGDLIFNDNVQVNGYFQMPTGEPTNTTNLFNFTSGSGAPTSTSGDGVLVGSTYYDDVAKTFYIFDGTNWVPNGNVSSVDLTSPSDLLAVSGNPITSSGTLALAKVSQPANQAYITPDGAPGVPTFRNLVVNDLPTIPNSKLQNSSVTLNSGTGISVTGGSPLSLGGAATVALQTPVVIANGGTNSTTALNNNRIMTSQSGQIREAAALTNGQLLVGSTGAAPVAANITAGSGISVTNGAGSITITNANPGGSQTLQQTLVNGDRTLTKDIQVSNGTNILTPMSILSSTSATGTVYTAAQVISNAMILRSGQNTGQTDTLPGYASLLTTYNTTSSNDPFDLSKELIYWNQSSNSIVLATAVGDVIYLSGDTFPGGTSVVIPARCVVTFHMSTRSGGFLAFYGTSMSPAGLARTLLTNPFSGGSHIRMDDPSAISYFNAIRIGNNNYVPPVGTDANQIFMGDTISLTGQASIGIGSNLTSTFDRTVAFGNNVTNTANDEMRFGGGNQYIICPNNIISGRYLISDLQEGSQVVRSTGMNAPTNSTTVITGQSTAYDLSAISHTYTNVGLDRFNLRASLKYQVSCYIQYSDSLMGGTQSKDLVFRLIYYNGVTENSFIEQLKPFPLTGPGSGGGSVNMSNIILTNANPGQYIKADVINPTGPGVARNIIINRMIFSIALIN